MTNRAEPEALAEALELQAAQSVRFSVPTIAISLVELPLILAALRQPVSGTEAVEGMRERCAQAALRSCYGTPSMWPGKYPRGWRQPIGWPDHQAPEPADAAMHDNGCMDVFIAIRALPLITDGGDRG